MNKKLMMTSLVLGLVYTGLAEPKKYATKEEAIAAHRAAVEKVGGIIQRPIEGPAVLFVNEQKTVPAERIASYAADVAAHSRFSHRVQVREPAEKPSPLTENYLADTNVAAVVAICENGACKNTIAIFPESNYAIINVSALAADKPDADKLAERVRKEMVRCFGYLFGAGYSPRFPNSAMDPVYSLRSLDRMPCRGFGLDSVQAIARIMEDRGMTVIKRTSYQRACEEGWAPAPTNEIQKALWEAAKTNVNAKAKNPKKTK